MNLRRQIESLRNAANELSLSGAEVKHCESGVRGRLLVRAAEPVEAPCERWDFARPLLEGAIKGFMRRLLCGNAAVEVVEEPWRTSGFPFAAAEATRRGTARKLEARLEGIGHSFIYGDRGAIAQLAQSVAVPAVGYLTRAASDATRCDDLRLDPMVALGEWVYMVYDIGMKTGDACLRRNFRFLMPVGRGNSPDDIISGFEGNASIDESSFGHPRLWKVLWSAAGRRDVAYGRLGLNLAVASRIALDHLLDMKLRYVPPTKMRGAPRQHDPAKDRKIMQEWAQARGKAGLTRKEFCDKKGITMLMFVQAQDRHRKQIAAASMAR